MKTSVVKSWLELDKLRTEWNGLLLRSRASSIFLTWEWFEAWFDAIEGRVEPFVVTVRNEDGFLVGIAPCYLAQLRVFKALSYRTIRYMADVATGAEYPDWIVDPLDEQGICRHIASTFARSAEDWDVMWLPKVAGWTGALERISNPLSEFGLRFHVRSRDFSAVKLAASVGEFEDAIPAKRRQQMRRNSRRVRSIDGVELIRCDSAEQLDEFLDALFELHQRRWKSLGIDGSFERKPVEEVFYRKFAPVALQNGWLGLFGLKQNGVFKAVQYGYIFNGAYHQLQEGFDPDFEQGAGNALRHYVIAECIADGIQSYDFLGGWTEHKRRWGAERRSGHDLFIGSNKLKSRVLFIGEIWPSGRLIDQEGTVTRILRDD